MALFVLGLGMSSCQQSKEDYVEEVKDFIEEVSEKAEDLSEEDWADLDKDFDELVKKADKFSDFTSEQMMELVKLQGQYAGIKVKSGTKSMIKGLNKGLEQGQKAVEGFLKGMEAEEK